MLPSPSVNEKEFWLDRCTQKKKKKKKKKPGEGKLTCFYIWGHNSYMYYTECIKLFDIKIYLAQQQVQNAFVCLTLVTFRTCISVDFI